MRFVCLNNEIKSIVEDLCVGVRPETRIHGWKLFYGPFKRRCKFEAGQGRINWRADPRIP